MEKGKVEVPEAELEAFRKFQAEQAEAARKEKEKAEMSDIQVLRDKQDAMQMMLETALKYNEAVANNRNISKFAVDNIKDDKETRAKKWDILMRACLANDLPKYNEVAKELSAVTRGFVTTNSSAQYNVPSDVRTDLLYTTENFGILGRDTMNYTTQSNSVQLPFLNTSISVGFVAQASAPTSQSGAPTPVTLSIAAMKAILGTFSEETLDDAPSLYNSWVQILGNAIMQKRDDTLFNGDGTAAYGSFKGIFHEVAATGGITEKSITGGALSTLTIDDLRSIISAAPTSARAGAKFYFHRTFEPFLYGMKDFNNRPIFIEGNVANPATLLGYPVELSEVCPDVSGAVGSGTKFLAFGNLKNSCHFVDRQQMTMKIGSEGTVDGEAMFAEGKSALRVIERWALKVYTMPQPFLGASNNVRRLGLVTLATA